jgi:hypothetical protein
MYKWSSVQYTWLNAGLFSVLCLIALFRNSLFDHYIVSSVLPFDQILYFEVTLWLVSCGLHLQFNPVNQASRFLNELLIGLLVFTLVLSGVNAIQFTPYAPIDKTMVLWDRFLHVNVLVWVSWLHTWPKLKSGLTLVYQSLTLALFSVPLLLIFTRRYAILHEFYRLLLISATLGYLVYYFFPTNGPASVFGGTYFTSDQYAVAVRFNEIHHHLVPSAVVAGIIAFPSFHVIWGWFVVYSVRCWKTLFIVLSCWNAVLVVSCVLVGGHYVVDVIGSVGVILLTHWINRCYDSRTFFRCEY